MNLIRSTILLVSIIQIAFFFSCGPGPFDDKKGNKHESISDPRIKENVYYLDSSNFLLNRAESDIELGSFFFNKNDSLDLDLSQDDIILVYDSRDGFLRKVESFEETRNGYSVSTKEAKLSEVILEGQFDFNMDLSGVEMQKKELEIDLSNTELYQGDETTITITEGRLKFNPNFNFDLDYSLIGGLEYFNFSSNSTQYDLKSKILVEIGGSEKIEENFDIAFKPKKILQKLTGTKIIIPVSYNLTLRFEMDAEAALVTSFETELMADGVVSSKVNYENDRWTYDWGWKGQLDFTRPDLKINSSYKFNFNVRPVVEVNFFTDDNGITLSAATMTEANLDFSSKGNWFNTSDLWFQGTAQGQISILDFFEQQSEEYTYNTEKINFTTPDKIELFSGGNQKGDAEKELDEAIVFKATNSNNEPEADVLVWAEVIDGDGSLATTNLKTNDEGLVQFNWTLGPYRNGGAQRARFSAYNGQDELLNNEGVTVQASASKFNLKGSWLVSYYAKHNDGTTYLNTQYKFNCDASGEGPPPYDYRKPYVSMDWKTRDNNSYDIYYYGGQIHRSGGSIVWAVDVINFDDKIFYSPNWNEKDFVWKFKLERI